MRDTLGATRLDELLASGTLVTTPDGQVRAAVLTIDDRVLLEERDLVDPAGRMRVERLSAGPLAWGGDLVRSVPLFSDDALLGWLIAVTVDGLGPDLGTIARLSDTLADQMTQQRLALEAGNDRLREIWAELRAGRGDAEQVGWEFDQPLIVLAAALDPVRGSWIGADGTNRERFAFSWREQLDHCGAPARLIDLGESLVMILPVSLVPGVDELVGAVSVGRSFSVGVSRVVAGVAQIPDAAREAERALVVGQDQGGGATTYFQRLGLDRLITLVPEADAVAYAADMLGPLAVDTAEAAELRRTLQLLLDTDFNIAETARLQYLHFMTVRFRVTKFERWLGSLADDPPRRLDVAVALRMLALKRP